MNFYNNNTECYFSNMMLILIATERFFSFLHVFAAALESQP